MTVGYLPPRLPVSCLTMAPKFDRPDMSVIHPRGPLAELNRDNRGMSGQAGGKMMGEPMDCYLKELHQKLK